MKGGVRWGDSNLNIIQKQPENLTSMQLTTGKEAE